MRVGLQITKNPDKYKKLISLFDMDALDDVTFIHIPDLDSLKNNFKELDVLVCYGISPKYFEYRSENLKWIHIGASGVDGNLFPEILKSRVMITNAKGINSKPVAEFIISQILYFSKKLDACQEYKTEKKWNQWELASQTTQLSDLTLGIIGYGEIGKELSKLAKSFGMEVLATRRLQKKVESKKFVDSLVPTSDMNMLIKRSDFLAVACPLTPNTENMIDKKVFKIMKKSAVIINTSRGGIINEDDLIQALKNKDISGAALDVYATEPLDPKSELFDIKNVLMSPHISGNFSSYQEIMIKQFNDMLIKHLNNKALKNRVCKKRLY